MAIPQPGKKAPDFTLLDQDGTEHRLSSYAGKWVLVYFYPKDDTPGCTAQACDLRDQYADLKKTGLIILGISTDTVAKHKKFAEKYHLPFTLLADAEKVVVQQYGVWGEKKFMGKTFHGTRRTSFLVAPDGVIAKVYENVKARSHAEMIAGDLTILQQA